MALLRPIAPLGHPVLRTSAGPADLPASDAVRAPIADMLATLADADGVGIAAPHVRESAARSIVASRPKPCDPTAPLMEPEIVIDPEIIARSDELEKDREGCPRIAGLRGLVPRRRRIRAVSDRRGAVRPARVRRRRGADLARWNAGGMTGPFERMDRP